MRSVAALQLLFIWLDQLVYLCRIRMLHIRVRCVWMHTAMSAALLCALAIGLRVPTHALDQEHGVPRSAAEYAEAAQSFYATCGALWVCGLIVVLCIKLQFGMQMFPAKTTRKGARR